MKTKTLQKRTTRLFVAACCALGMTLSLCVVRAAAQQQARPAGAQLPREMTTGQIETVAEFTGAMPTGVTVSQTGRIFVNFPRWEDKPEFTVVELRGGREVPFPQPDINRFDPARDAARAADRFVSVQSVVVDPQDRLWIVDTGSVNFDPVIPGGPKLVCVDLRNDRVVKTVRFAPDVVLPTTYLNDIRFDLRKGREGTAYITDSSDKGPNAIIVVDLATGTSRRRLNAHPSTTAEPDFRAFPEGMDMRSRRPGAPPQNIRVGADGIAISADGARLYYCPLASRKLYSVSCDALLDATLSDAQVAATVRDEGEKPASDGLESDAEGHIYATAYEQNGIVRRNVAGDYETLVHDPRVLWADTLAVAADGYLYFTNNQLHRQAGYNNGRDMRSKPYTLLRVRIGGTPVRLR